jgi:hypothetical protein
VGVAGDGGVGGYGVGEHGITPLQKICEKLDPKSY